MLRCSVWSMQIEILIQVCGVYEIEGYSPRGEYLVVFKQEIKLFLSKNLFSTKWRLSNGMTEQVLRSHECTKLTNM